MMTYAHYSQIRTIYFCLCVLSLEPHCLLSYALDSVVYFGQETALIVNGRWILIKSAFNCALGFILLMYFKTSCKHAPVRWPYLLVSYLAP